jgi:hypothetical protein
MDPRFFRKFADLIESAEQPTESFAGIGRQMSQGMTIKDTASKHLDENYGDSPVASAITRRIMNQRPDLLKFGPQSVMAAIDDVADYVGDVEEIGSSDVSGWVKQVERMLNENPPEAFGVGQD